MRLALAGPWRVWESQVPVGFSFEWTAEALLACGDPDVIELVTAARQLRAVADRLLQSSHRR